MQPTAIKKIKEVEEIIYPPFDHDLKRHKTFRAGQADRKAGLPCKSSNGCYLEGWYEPDKKAYYISEDQVDAFGL
jgi:hypothetical protein